MPQRQPSTIGVQRIGKTSFIHEEVEKNLQDIADAEDKSFSYVVAEIVYKFFGLKVTGDAVKICRARRTKTNRKRNRRSGR